MLLNLRRAEPGVYRDDEHAVEIRNVGTDGWQLVVDGSWVTTLATKKACVSAWESRDRLPKDRTTTDTLKLFRRSQIAKGTKLTIDGLGKCFFDAYTRKDDGSEWIDVTVCRTLARRVVRPDRIRTVHRGQK